MRDYSILIKGSAQDGLAKIPKKFREAIGKRIDSLAQEPRPHGVTFLRGPLRGFFRIRVGDFRVVYAIDDDSRQVLITMIRDR